MVLEMISRWLDARDDN
ncbi:hypothetical protein [Enterococcus sp. RIT-PI-f]